MSTEFKSLADKVELKNAFTSMLCQHDFTHEVTLAHRFPDTYSRGRLNLERVFDLGKSALKRLHFNLDKNVLGLGGGVARYSKSRRTYFVAIPEDAGTNLHYHMLMRLPIVIACEAWLQRMLSSEWLKVCRSSQFTNRTTLNQYSNSTSVVCRKINSEEHRVQVTGYFTKKLWKDENYSHVVFSDEFLPGKVLKRSKHSFDC